MQITDTIADLLTRIRNANSAKHATVDVPASNVKKAIAQILVDEGYVKRDVYKRQPSRIFKGKGMPGQMGNEKVTVQNLEVVKIDAENNLIALKGAIPGPKGGIVSIVDSVKALSLIHI